MNRAVPVIGWVTALMLWVAPAQAFNVEFSEARYADEQFKYELVVTLDAPIDKVEQVLRDYAEYPSLNERILSSRVLERPERDVALIETIVKVCFGPFCRNVTRVERVLEARNMLLAIADPKRSDVIAGETRSELSTTHHGTTRVKYKTKVVPGFWVPAVGGRRMMLKLLETETSDLFLNVEKRAQRIKTAAP